MQKEYAAVLRAYEETGSIRSASRKLRISHQKVRKMLISAGVYSSERSVQIANLRREGLSVPEIAENLGITENAVLSNMPYQKVVYNRDHPSKNAKAIRECRARKRDAGI